jgi:hypothetical protein
VKNRLIGDNHICPSLVKRKTWMPVTPLRFHLSIGLMATTDFHCTIRWNYFGLCAHQTPERIRAV